MEKYTQKEGNKGRFIGAMFINLSKAFDSINPNSLVAKLEGYAFSAIILHLMRSYLKSNNQRVNINTNFTEWGIILTGILQGSILGQLLFPIC